MFLEFCRWLEQSWLGGGIRDSLWLFPVIEAVHLIALAMIGGAVLIVDLRLLGGGVRGVTIAELASNAETWLVRSLVVLLVTGILLFSAEATKCYGNPAFWVKMSLILAAVTFTFTVRRRVVTSDEALRTAFRRSVALASVMLWSGVGIAGRAIGFY